MTQKEIIEDTLLQEIATDIEHLQDNEPEMLLDKEVLAKFPADQRKLIQSGHTVGFKTACTIIVMLLAKKSAPGRMAIEQLKHEKGI